MAREAYLRSLHRPPSGSGYANSFSSRSASTAAEFGFCPVIRLRSSTMYGSQIGPRLNSTPTLSCTSDDGLQIEGRLLASRHRRRLIMSTFGVTPPGVATTTSWPAVT